MISPLLQAPRLTPIPHMRRHLDTIKSMSHEEQIQQLRTLFKLREHQAQEVIRGWKENTLDQHTAP